MTNREIARVFNKLAKVMELHGENAFKIRSYANAYNTIRRLPDEVYETPRDQLLEIKGIGKNIADKIEELKDSGTIQTLERYLDQTPPGIVEMLGIKGLGAKKILTVWKELEIENPGELLYACQENRLIELKGFGSKTQLNLAQQLEYYFDAQGKYLYGHVQEEATELVDKLRGQFGKDHIAIVNDIRRQLQIVTSIDVVGTVSQEDVWSYISTQHAYAVEGDVHTYKGTRIQYTQVAASSIHQTIFEGSASSDFIAAWIDKGFDTSIEDSSQAFETLGLAYIPPESRESPIAIQNAEQGSLNLIELSDIKGVVHAHSTWSDGANTLQDMAKASQDLGYQYLVISDHSKSAFYAGGLKPHEVYDQMSQIDELNAANGAFTIFKSIESDILYDGRLDYEDEVLEKFDLVIASVHAHLKMDIVKATDRVITAVSNPYTRILGHPTGRLLLSRKGYPLDHMAVIDACAEYGVVIELNANPYRLDLDWTWIPYAIEKGVKISVNPDAHSTKGITNIQYGISAARKALVSPGDCINTLDVEDFSTWIDNK